MLTDLNGECNALSAQIGVYVSRLWSVQSACGVIPPSAADR